MSPDNGDTASDDAVSCSLPDALNSERLYQQIASLSGNREMIKFTQSFCSRTRCVRLLELEDAQDTCAIAADARALMSALRSRDVKCATGNLARLLETKCGRLSGLVKEGNSRALMADFP
jgi:DNA-binding GntR family transcriptional regulator